MTLFGPDTADEWKSPDLNRSGMTELPYPLALVPMMAAVCAMPWRPSPTVVHLVGLNRLETHQLGELLIAHFSPTPMFVTGSENPAEVQGILSRTGQSVLFSGYRPNDQRHTDLVAALTQPRPTSGAMPFSLGPAVVVLTGTELPDEATGPTVVPFNLMVPGSRYEFVPEHLSGVDRGETCRTAIQALRTFLAQHHDEAFHLELNETAHELFSDIAEFCETNGNCEVDSNIWHAPHPILTGAALLLLWVEIEGLLDEDDLSNFTAALRYALASAAIAIDSNQPVVSEVVS
jgi:hypothetical protein